MTIQRNRLVLPALAGILLIIAGPAQAAGVQKPVEQMVLASEKVVLGSVVSRASYWEGDFIYTDVILAPEVELKGVYEGALVVRVPGGIVGDTELKVSHTAEFADGERVLVFLARDGRRYEVVGRDAGKYSLSRDLDGAAGAAEAVMQVQEATAGRSLYFERGEVISYFQRLAMSGTVKGDGARMAGGNPEAAASCYTTAGKKWADGSATFSIGSGIPASWVAPITAAATTWSGAGAKFSFALDSNSANAISSTNLVTKYGAQYENVWAVACTWWYVSTGMLAKATIEMNSIFAWSPSGEPGKGDVRNILTHELGHWLHLADIYSPGECSEVTMWGYAGAGETKKHSIEQPDVDGIVSLYGAASALAAPSLITPADGAGGIAATGTTLAWGVVSGATSYEVYFGTAASPPLVATLTSAGYPSGSLAAGTKYYWKVVARSGTLSSASVVRSFTAAALAPSAPALSAPSNGATGVAAGGSQLSWSAVSGATSYDVYFGTAATPALAATVTSPGYSLATLAASTKYYWKVTARNGAGTGASGVWSFTTAAAAPTAPQQAIPVNGATGVTPAGAKLTWSAVSGATSYEVYFGTASSPARAATVTTTSYQPGTLAAATTYYWKVVAKNSIGAGTSAIWSFATGSGAPTAPMLLGPANGAPVAIAGTSLVWSGVSGATSYEVYFGKTSSPALVATMTGTSYRLPTLVPRGTRYYWRVVAKNGAGAASSATWWFGTR